MYRQEDMIEDNKKIEDSDLWVVIKERMIELCWIE